MSKNNFKKHKSLYVLSSFFVALTGTTFAITLSSCANNTYNDVMPSTNAASFTSLFSNISPTVASALSSNAGMNSFKTAYVNKLLQNWFNGLNNSSIELQVNDWNDRAQKAYDDEYNSYRREKGSNWRILFQNEVLDPIGGTKQAYLNNQIRTHFKQILVDAVFNENRNYLAYKTGTNGSSNEFSNYTPVNQMTYGDLIGKNSQYVNGATTGTKNNFSFTGYAINEETSLRTDFGYADLKEFILDEWIKNTLPLPLSMTLWKNGTSSLQLNQLFSSYFRSIDESYVSANSTAPDPDNSEDTGTTAASKFVSSYAFQYFDESNMNPDSYSTTSKFNLLVNGLSKGSFVDTNTGLIRLPLDYTEDSSTSLIATATSLYNDYVTPFSTAAWYKLSNVVFGVSDENVTVAEKLDDTNIMNNFMVYSNSSSGSANPTQTTALHTDSDGKTKGIFKFPYPLKWTNPVTDTESSVFGSNYRDAVGVIDILDLSSNTTLTSNTSSQPSTSAASTSQLGNFILVRNQFGVHIIGIDRLNKLKEAFNPSNSSTNNEYDKRFTNFCNELRNTFIYYMALDASTGTSSSYGINDTLKSYFESNFENIIIKYVEKYIDDAQNNKNNLFGAFVTQNRPISETITFNQNFGFLDEYNSKNYVDYYNVLNELKTNTELRKIIDAALNYQYAVSANELVDTINKKVYDNQSKFNDNSDLTYWPLNGISGTLPFKRDDKTGSFTSLVKLIDILTTKTLPTTSSSTTKTNTNDTRNSKASNFTLVANTSNNNQNPTTAQDSLKSNKDKYAQAVASYINNANLTVINGTTSDFVAQSSYLFTNDQYINNALLSSDVSIANIAYNLYVQRYLYPTGKRETSNNSSSTAGSVSWLNAKMNDALTAVYKVSSLTSTDAIYASGDWTDSTTFKQKINEVFDNKWNLNEFSYSFSNTGANNTNNSFYSYRTLADATSYFDLLLTLRYMSAYNSQTKKFAFTPLYDYLNRATTVTTTNSSRAFLAWQVQDSVKENTTFGYSNITTQLQNTTSVSDIQTKVSNDSKFKPLPVLLTNKNSYSWNGAIDPFSLTDATTTIPSNTTTTTKFNKSDISYTKSDKYWNLAPMSSTSNSSSGSSTTNNTTNVGFLGFQFENTSQTSGLGTSLPSDVFDNKTYSYTSNSNIQYLGMFYSYGSRNNLLNHIKSLSTPYLLQTFYITKLKDSGLPINQSTIDKIDEMIKPSSTTSFDQLQNEIVNLVNDKNQVPDKAFERITSLPLWRTQSDGTFTTLFDDELNPSAIKTQYIITQFNNSDVKNMVSNGELNTGANAYLGLDVQTFFNAIVMLAQDVSIFKTNAINDMFNVVGKIAIYDIRLIDMINREHISNYEEWNKVKEIE